MLKYKSVLFDFDGTLVNTKKFVNEFTQDFLTRNPYKDYDYTRFFDEINNGDTSIDPNTTENYWSEYKIAQITGLELFPETKEVIKFLVKNGVSLGIVSNSVKIRIDTVLKQCGILDYFGAIIGKLECSQRKPNPEPLLKAIELLGADRSSSLYVGDFQEDIETAKNAAVDMAFYAENKPYVEFLKNYLEQVKPTYIIPSLLDLKTIIHQ